MAGINDYLEELGVQEVRKEKKIKLARNRTVDALCKTFELAVKKILKYEAENDDIFDSFGIYTRFGICTDVIGRAIYTAKDVTNFSVRLKEYEKQENFSEYAGLFLSALINKAEGEKVEILTSHLSKLIDYVGYRAEKDITVIGDLGSCTGAEMSYGRMVHVKGSVQDNTGRELYRGLIFVEGNAGEQTGDRATGGIITVQGNAGDWTGFFMGGGTIHVYGDSGNYTGRSLKKGFIHVYGNAKDHTGYFMYAGLIEINGSAGRMTGMDSVGGKICVGGKIRGIARKDRKCKIFRRGKQLR